ncbi:vanadium-dependent haloperoxidase [Pelagicoccus sp. SDUM812002]|uniref:vanadium-dependent haloperoxidase n=1 Tax=Pelagicoccus sp. SDUM812002 TaxID=3041266 RepID=UPI00280DA0A9|nr:vanadium-dependent haloperoxidase [Pelagicoccus sp. SDUM812002]MDQ8186497.1 vanadium-dependent haloperoxidase [Pelagicoccus sp. SDUM812002]
MKHKIRALLFICIGIIVTASPSTAAENPILFWNNQVVNATRLSRNPPPVAGIHFATFHIALFDIANSFERKREGWLVNEKAPDGANLEAALAAAGHLILSQLWGNVANPRVIELAYQTALSEVPEGESRDAGIAWGEEVARRVLEKRSTAGLGLPSQGSYVSSEIGKWRETPPGFRPPVTPRLGEVEPFALESSKQFRAPPPLSHDSKEYAQEIAFVNKVGPRDGAERTEYQTLSTPFWADDLGSATPPGHWNEICRTIVRGEGIDEDVYRTAYIFAMLNIAGADAGITAWETKYYYSTWRPETAIREIREEDNPVALQNPDFIPNMPSPAFPSYTSGHSTYTAAMSRMIEHCVGRDDISFSVNSDGLPGAVRHYEKLSDARREVGMSRVWGGIHVMSDNIEGQKAGLAVADWIFENTLQKTK